MSQYIWVDGQRIWFDDDTLTPGQMIVEARKTVYGGSPSPYGRDDTGMRSEYQGRTPEMGEPRAVGPGLFGSAQLESGRDARIDATKAPSTFKPESITPPSRPEEAQQRQEFFKSIDPNYITGERLAPLAEQWANQTAQDVEQRDARISGKYLEAPEEQQFQTPPVGPTFPETNPLRDVVRDFKKAGSGIADSEYGRKVSLSPADERDRLQEYVAEKVPIPEGDPISTAAGPASAGLGMAIGVARGMAKMPGTIRGAAEAGIEFVAPGYGQAIRKVRQKWDVTNGVWKEISGSDQDLGATLDEAAKTAQQTYESNPEIQSVRNRRAQIDDNNFLGIAKHYLSDPAALPQEVARQAPQVAAMAATGLIGKAGGAIGKVAAGLVPSSLEALETSDAVEQYEKTMGVKLDPSMRDTVVLGKGLISGAQEYFGFESATGLLWTKLSPAAKMRLLHWAGKAGGELGMSMLIEGSTETGQEFTGNVAEKLLGIDGGKSLFSGLGEAGFLGAVMGPLMAGGLGGVKAQDFTKAATDREILETIALPAIQAKLKQVVPPVAAKSEAGLPMPAEPTVEAAISTSPVPVPVQPPTGQVPPPVQAAPPEAPPMAPGSPTAPPSPGPAPVAPPPAEAPVAPPEPISEVPPPAPDNQGQDLLYKEADGSTVPVKMVGQVGPQTFIVQNAEGTTRQAPISKLVNPDGSPLPGTPEVVLPSAETPGASAGPAPQPVGTDPDLPGVTLLDTAPQQLAGFKIGDMVAFTPDTKKAMPILGFGLRETKEGKQPVAILERIDGVKFAHASPQKANADQITAYEKAVRKRTPKTEEAAPVVTEPVTTIPEPVAPPEVKVETPPAPAPVAPVAIDAEAKRKAFDEAHAKGVEFLAARQDQHLTPEELKSAMNELVGRDMAMPVIGALERSGHLEKNEIDKTPDGAERPVVETTYRAVTPKAPKATKAKPLAETKAEPVVATEETVAEAEAPPPISDIHYGRVVKALREAGKPLVTVASVQRLGKIDSVETAIAVVKRLEQDGITGKYDAELKGRVLRTPAQVEALRKRREKRSGKAAPEAVEAPPTRSEEMVATPPATPTPEAVKTPPGAKSKTPLAEFFATAGENPALPLDAVVPSLGDRRIKVTSKPYGDANGKDGQLVNIQTESGAAGSLPVADIAIPGIETVDEKTTEATQAEAKPKPKKASAKKVAKEDKLSAVKAKVEKAAKATKSSREEREENTGNIPENSLPGIPEEKTGRIPENRESSNSILEFSDSPASAVSAAAATAVPPTTTGTELTLPKTDQSPTAPMNSKGIDLSVGNVVQYAKADGTADYGTITGQGKMGGIKLKVMDPADPAGRIFVIVDPNAIDTLIADAKQALEMGIADTVGSTEVSAPIAPVTPKEEKRSQLPKDVQGMLESISKGTTKGNTTFAKVVKALNAKTNKSRAQKAASFALTGAPARTASALRKIFTRRTTVLASLREHIAEGNDDKILATLREENPALETTFLAIRNHEASKGSKAPISDFLKPLLGPAGSTRVPLVSLYKPANPGVSPLGLTSVRNNTLMEEFRNASPNATDAGIGVAVGKDGSVIFASEDDNFFLETDMETVRQLLEEPHLTLADVTDRGLFKLGPESTKETKDNLGASARTAIKEGVVAHKVAFVDDTTGQHYVALVGADGTINLGNAGLVDYLTRRGAEFAFGPDGKTVYATVENDGKSRVIGSFESSGYERTFTGFRIPTAQEEKIIREMLGEDTGEDAKAVAASESLRIIPKDTTPDEAAVYDIYAAKNADSPLSYEDTMRIVSAFQDIYGHNLEIQPILSADNAQHLYDRGVIGETLLAIAKDHEASAFGSFSDYDGRIVLNIHHINSASKYPTRALVNTLVHEVLGHHGFARFLSDPQSFYRAAFAENKAAILNDPTLLKVYGTYWGNLRNPKGPTDLEYFEKKIAPLYDRGNEAAIQATNRIVDEWMAHQVEKILAQRLAGKMRNPPKWYEKAILAIRDFINKVLGKTDAGKKIGVGAGGGVRFVDVEALIRDRNWRATRDNVNEIFRRIEDIFSSENILDLRQQRDEMIDKNRMGEVFTRLANRDDMSHLGRVLLGLPRREITASDLHQTLINEGITAEELHDSGLDYLLGNTQKKFTPDSYIKIVASDPLTLQTLRADYDIVRNYRNRLESKSITDAFVAEKKLEQTRSGREMAVMAAAKAEELGYGEQHSDVVEAMDNANGIVPDVPFMQRVKQTLIDKKQVMVQAFPHLFTTKAAKDAAVNDLLRLLNDADNYAETVAKDVLRDITAGLNPGEETALGYIVALRDIVNEYEVDGDANIYDGAAVQFGITSLEHARAELASMEFAANEKVRAAIAKREAFMEAFVQKLVETGLLPEAHKDPKTYFRRQTLQYYRMSDAAKRSWSSRPKLLAAQHGSFKKRTGAGSDSMDDTYRGLLTFVEAHRAKTKLGWKPDPTSQAAYEKAQKALSDKRKDFNTNYRQAEFEHVAAAIHTMRAMELVESMRRLIDSGPFLRDVAKQKNLKNAYGTLENHIKVNELIDEAKTLPKNKAGAARRAEIRSILEQIDPLYESRRKFAIGKSMLGAALKSAQRDGRLSHVPPEYHQEMEALIRGAMTKSELAEAEAEDSGAPMTEDEWDSTNDAAGMFDLMKWLDRNFPNEYRGIPVIYQALADKHTAIKNAVIKNGHRFETPESVIGRSPADRALDELFPLPKDATPEQIKARESSLADLVAFSPDDKHLMYHVMTVGDRMLDIMMKQIQSEGIENVDPEALALVLQKAKPAIAFGPLREQWFIPRNIAKQLNEYGQDRGGHGTWEWMVGKWKWWKLMGPFSYLKYNTNNTFGDLDAVLATYPGALKEVLQAIKDLKKLHGVFGSKAKFERDATVRELEELVSRGIIGSGMSTNELSDLETEMTLALRNGYKDLTQIQEVWGQTGAYIKHGAAYAARMANMRENVLRLAVHRYLSKRFEADGQIPLGASRYKEIKMMTIAYADAEQRLRNAGKVNAADKLRKEGHQAIIDKVARELMGDYGNISHLGQRIRRKLIPFWSWMEINAPRYYNILRNASIDPTRTDLSGSTLAKRIGLRAAQFAVRAPAMFMKTHFMFLAISLFNHWFHGDDEEALGSGRNQMHMILGKNSDGTIRTLRAQGALSDVYGWFGLENIFEDIRQVREGEISAWDKLRYEGSKGLINKLTNSLDPFSKGVFEGMTGVKIFPSAFKEGASFERERRYTRGGVIEEFAKSIIGYPAPELMQMVTGTPTRRKDIVDTLLTYRTDPNEQAFWDTKDLVQKWIDKTGRGTKAGSAPNTAEVSTALYNYKKAIQYDRPALADKWAMEYFKLGGSPQGLAQSIRTSGPLTGINNMNDRKAFYESLTPAQKKMVDRARTWYEGQEEKLKGKAEEIPGYKEAEARFRMEQRAKRHAPRIPRGANSANTYIPGSLNPRYQ